MTNNKKPKKPFELDALDLSNMPDMGELLGDYTHPKAPKSAPRNPPPQKPGKHPPARSRPSTPPIHGLDTRHVPDMDTLLQAAGAMSVPPQKSDAPPARPPSKPTRKNTPKKRRLTPKSVVVIDGSNIARLDADHTRHSSLRNALALVVAIAKVPARPICIFDANERHLLAANPTEPQAARFLQQLIHHLPVHFRQTPPGTDADVMLLRIADEHNALIISNDRFTNANDPHPQKHAWLTTRHHRIVHAKLRNDTIQCPELDLAASRTRSLEQLVNDCFQLLSA